MRVAFPTQYTLKNIFSQSIAQIIIIYLASNTKLWSGEFEFSWLRILFAVAVGLLYGLGVIRYNRYMQAHPEKYDMSKMTPKYLTKTYAEHKADRETKSKDA
jgi:hypothetical protein